MTLSSARRIVRRVGDATWPLRRLLHQAAQLGDGFGVVVDLKAQHHIVMQPHAAALLHNEECGALFASRITAGALPGFERGNETECQ